MRPSKNTARHATPPDTLLDAAEAVVARKGFANLTLDAVAGEIGLSKGGVLHYFPTKDRLVEAMVVRAAELWRANLMRAYDTMPPGPGRMTRALIHYCLSDTKTSMRELQRRSSTCFAALAQSPKLLEPMRAAYDELQERLTHDELPLGVGETVGAAVSGLWLYSVLGLVSVDRALVFKVRRALEAALSHSFDISATQRAPEVKRRAGARSDAGRGR